MNTLKLILLLLCWASILPAMEAKKSVYEQALELHKLAKEQKPCFLLKLPDEMVDAIAKKLIKSVAHAQSEKELQKSIQTITRLQTTCITFNIFLNDKKYQEQLKQSFRNTLRRMGIRFDLFRSIENKQNSFVINVLIKASANPNMSKKYGQTLLMLAAGNGLFDIATALINAKADKNRQDNSGWTALIFAATSGNTDISIALINAGADLNLQSFGGRTPLMQATFWGHTDIVIALINAKVDKNRQDNSGWTALMFAAFHGDTGIVSQLINAGANLFLKNINNKTALDIARETGQTEIVQLLETAYVYTKATPHRTADKMADKQIEPSAQN